MRNKLSVHLNTKDPLFVEIIQRYWQVGANGDFLYTLVKLALDFNISQPQISTIIKKFSEAKLRVDNCLCGQPIYELVDRGKLKKKKDIKIFIAPKRVCQDCEGNRMILARNILKNLPFIP